MILFILRRVAAQAAFVFGVAGALVLVSVFLQGEDRRPSKSIEVTMLHGSNAIVQRNMTGVSALSDVGA